MNEFSFRIGCPSCETVFEVTDQNLVGQIIACPKCGGMILIEPPNENTTSSNETADDLVVQQVSVEKKDDYPVGGDKYNFVDSTASIEEGNILSRGEDNGKDCEVELPEQIAVGGKNDEAISPIHSRLIFLFSGVICALLVTCTTVVFTHFTRNNSPSVDNSQVADIIADDEQIEQENLSNPGNDSDERTENTPFEADDELDYSRGEGSDALNNEFVSTEDVNANQDSTAGKTLDVADGETDGEMIQAGEAVEKNEEEEKTDSESYVEQSDATVESKNEQMALNEEEVKQEQDNAALIAEFDESEFEEANTQEDEDGIIEEDDLGAVASTVDTSLQTSITTLRVSPRKFDLDARMKLAIRSITFPQSPAAAVRLLAEFTGVPIDFDLANFNLLRASMNSTLDLTLQNVDAMGALDTLAELLKWKPEVQENHITISVPDNSVVEENFTVTDLCEDGNLPYNGIGTNYDSTNGNVAVDELKTMIRSLVEPDCWQENGGQGTLVCEGNSLSVKTTKSNCKHVADLLERVRALHGREVLGGATPDALIAETLGWGKMSEVISFNLLKPITLQQAIEILEKNQKICMLWDDATLNELGVGRDSTTMARINDVTIDQTLYDLLEPLRLTYLILDENLFLITSKERAERYKTLEIHMFTQKEPMSKEQTLTLVEEMKSAIDPKSWDDPDVSLWIDAKSGCWLVRQSQPNQRALRRWLAERFHDESNALKK